MSTSSSCLLSSSAIGSTFFSNRCLAADLDVDAFFAEAFLAEGFLEDVFLELANCYTFFLLGEGDFCLLGDFDGDLDFLESYALEPLNGDLALTSSISSDSSSTFALSSDSGSYSRVFSFISSQLSSSSIPSTSALLIISNSSAISLLSAY